MTKRKENPAGAQTMAGDTDDRVREAVSRLAGGVAHDLNNILLVVQGYTDMAITEAQGGGPVGPLLDEVSQAATRATRLVRDLLIIGGNAAVSPRPMDLTTAIERDLREQENAEAAGPVFTWEPGESIPRIMMDESLLSRLLSSLGSWAREFSTGPALLRSLYVAAEDPYVLLSCEFPDAPLSAEAQRRIFDPYVRGVGSGKGPGLRLCVVRAIAQLLGGSATAESTNGGTRITVLLPARPAADPAPGPAPAPGPLRAAAERAEERPSTAATALPSILLAEDDDALRAIALKVLQKEGYMVLVARDGQEAVEIWEKNGPSIGLLLLDDVMPRMGGKAVLARIRAARPDIPAILAAGYAWSLDATKDTADCAILPKPWRPRDLLERVRAQLETRR